MTDEDNDKLAIASRLFVRLRRNNGRVIDIVWMMQNREYSAEVLRIAKQDQDPEVQKLAQRLESLLFHKAPPAEAAPPSEQDEVAAHYIGTLR